MLRDEQNGDRFKCEKHSARFLLCLRRPIEKTFVALGSTRRKNSRKHFGESNSTLIKNLIAISLKKLFTLLQFCQFKAEIPSKLLL